MAKKEATSTQMTSHLMFSLLPLQVLLAVVGYLNDIISTLFASNAVGADSMAAIGLYTPVTKAMTAAYMLLTAGATVLCTRYMGKNRMDKIQSTFSLTIVLGCIVGLVAAAAHVVAGILFQTVLLEQDPVVNALFAQYLFGKAVGTLPYVLGYLFVTYLSMENKLKLTTVASVAYVIANLAFHALFVLAFRMEALGLSLAASLGSWVYLAFLAQYYLRGKSFLRFDFSSLEWAETFEIVKFGHSSALVQAYYAVRSVIINAIILVTVGTVGLSAYATAYTFMNIFWSLPDAMESVSRMLIGLSAGEEDRQSLTDIMRVMFTRYVPLALAMTIAIVVFAEPLTNLYYHDPSQAIYQMTLWGIRLYPWCFPLSVITMHFSVYGNAMGKPVLVHGIQLLDGFVCAPLYMILLMPFMGIVGGFAAYPLRGITVCLFILAYSCFSNKKFPSSLDELMVIPEDFGVGPDEHMELYVKSMEDVVNVSREVRAFCAGQGIDSRRTFMSGLCLEEMAGNVVAHGFSKDKRDHNIGIRVTHKDDVLILRIKDDCVPFNPEEYHEILDPEDKAHGIGTRIVFGSATSIDYQHIFGLNALTIKF